MRRALTFELSQSEMRRMREEEEMTNQEIADALGINYQTVLKYIGPQPPHMRRAKGTYSVEKTAPIEEPAVACLAVVNSVVEVKSATRKYVIDRKEGTVRIYCPNGYEAQEMVIAYSDLTDFIAELKAIKNKIGEDISVPLEMW